MPRHATGNIAYRRMTSNHLCLHAGPPVCHVCPQTMTRHNVGGMFWEGLPGGQCAWVACRGWTTRRTSGPQLRHGVRRHGP